MMMLEFMQAMQHENQAHMAIKDAPDRRPWTTLQSTPPLRTKSCNQPPPR